MKFEVRLSRRTSRQLDSLDPTTRRRILLELEELQDSPFPHGAIKLQGRDETYRVRVGDYRILYEVLKKDGIILIEKVDHRSTVYDP